MEADKELHFKYSAILGAFSSEVCTVMGAENGPLCGLKTALLLGLLKELNDSRFDSADMAYNLGGATFGIAVPLFIREF